MNHTYFSGADGFFAKAQAMDWRMIRASVWAAYIPLLNLASPVFSGFLITELNDPNRLIAFVPLGKPEPDAQQMKQVMAALRIARRIADNPSLASDNNLCCDLRPTSRRNGVPKWVFALDLAGPFGSAWEVGRWIATRPFCPVLFDAMQKHRRRVRRGASC